ncbi:MAG: tetratricopeptide repeat protein [Treponema sp.]|jgi:tetratricopeptide (TPR) repeat protein|nr:tetratricopeptide repeat protein [Treponema sp.]
MRLKLSAFLMFFSLAAGISGLPAQTSFARGEELFMQNRPHEALSYLQAAVSEDPAHVLAFLYLGIVYLQMDRIEDAIATYQQILPRGGAQTAQIAFNLGNAHFMAGDPVTARRYYTQALSANPAFAQAHLNRANTFIRSGDLAEAVNDYQRYLALSPASPQRAQITRLIAFIQEEFVAEEQRRVTAERIAREQAAAEEQRRIIAEQIAREEAERRRLLLQEVAGAIHSVVDGTQGLSFGMENVQDFEGVFELE